MSARTVGKFAATIKSIEPWPDKDYATSWGSQTYEMGLDQVDEYHDKPATLSKALDTFLAGDSRPYALAGASYLLVAASREANGTYSQRGLKAAFEWLEYAQKYEPYRTDINFIEILIYIYSNQRHDARTVLDFLHKQSPHYYHLLVTEATYWQWEGKLDQMMHWYDKASHLADTTPKKVRLHSRIAEAYYSARKWEDSIKHYQKAVYFNKQNGQLWYNMSQAYSKNRQHQDANRCRKLAERFGYEANVRQVRFGSRRSPFRLLSWVFGR